MGTTDANDLRMYTVYNSPSDYPGQFVVRGCSVLAGGEIRHDPELFLACTHYIDIKAEMMARGLVKIVRDPSDDPCIVETWL